MGAPGLRRSKQVVGVVHDLHLVVPPIGRDKEEIAGNGGMEVLRSLQAPSSIPPNEDVDGAPIPAQPTSKIHAVSSSVAASIGQKSDPASADIHDVDVSVVAAFGMKHVAVRRLLAIQGVRLDPERPNTGNVIPTEHTYATEAKRLQAGRHVQCQQRFSRYERNVDSGIGPHLQQSTKIVMIGVTMRNENRLHLKLRGGQRAIGLRVARREQKRVEEDPGAVPLKRDRRVAN